MLCVCVGDVMGVVFSVCIVRRGAVGARVCVWVWLLNVSNIYIHDLQQLLCLPSIRMLQDASSSLGG